MTLSFLVDTLLPRLAAASLQSLLLVAAVWALCRYLPRLSASARCWLWWLAALQLLVGVLWPTPLVLPLLPESFGSLIADAPSGLASSAALPASARLPFAIAGGDASATSRADAALLEFWPSWRSLLAGAWLLGLSVLLTVNLRAFLDTRRRIARSSASVPMPVAQAYRRLGDSLGLRRLPELRLSAEIESPQLLGPWPAFVLLPQHRIASMSPGELDMALHHELTHLRRRDLWWGWVPALAQQLFFFHPLAHLIAREYSLAREAACDAAVLDSRRYAPQDYGRLLMRLGVAPRPQAGLASASPTYLILKRRLTMLQDAAPASRLLALSLTAAIALFGLAPYRIAAADTPKRNVSTIDRSDGETRITELGAGTEPQRWAVRGERYYRIDQAGGYHEVTDSATRERLRQRMRESREAAVAAEQATREAAVAVEAGARAAEKGSRAAEEGRRAAAEGRRAAEEARREAELGQRAAEEARREAEKSRREAERARAQAQRDAVQARVQAHAIGEHGEAGQVAAQARHTAELALRQTAEATRAAVEAAREVAEATRELGEEG
ncbi:M56 family metallopeptidase [Lysobacter antibioticus]|uniref:BlaR1 peptidase M56 family protein n=1 Tax=Lysobacter antibioticus TaxID=84531 RepID=A0A0S2F9A2_LYSAN|nr:M56 family metallopeptidase [Lysobacter antibioticus]ALN80067.1 blaR1 peptidase M56 family protein [Lysobacter antibioticus]